MSGSGITPLAVILAGTLRLDLENRQYKINGTNTMNNDPPSEDTKLKKICGVTEVTDSISPLQAKV
ncbi:hypothetical protein HYFRA_00010179 [Hymenoscyphus fraxineus]|uniref:Uncharacterized protein n=1 Tax=Hymenoscyphus fraxineus TaxID=746836 RepID=A0A9N9KWJ5_9HELO|nr:hypothetical protein HYFRA_00010179 [Hymenoscyphus fraxineus]